MRTACVSFVFAALLAAPLPADDAVLVSDLLKSIQRGINEAQPDIQRLGNVPPLDSVSLQIQAETDKSGSGGINLWFVKIGGSSDSKASTQLSFVLKPALPGSKNVAGPPLDTTIKDALIAAAKGVYDAQSSPNPVPLLLDSLTADFAFTVKKSGNAGVQFQLVPIGGSASVTGSRSDVQKITVKFAKASKPAATGK
jgi:hypothetical protein